MDGPWSILHVMRAPVGGLFRHVADLAREQTARGHRVGIIADAATGGPQAEKALAALGADLALGVVRTPMSRELGTSDWSAGRLVAERLRALAVDIVHGHGSKGGAYARLAGGRRLKVYTPHGGSLHYSRSSPIGFAYLTLEAVLARRTDLFLFESAYGRDTFRAKVAEPRGLSAVVHNGVAPAEFVPVEPAADAADILFVGELRRLKGVDVLLEALALARRQGHALTAAIVGGGPDEERFRAQAERLGLSGAATFAGPLPARCAFALGRRLVVPSRAESLPYIVLEAAAAGLPVIATAVGGIAEIFGPDAGRLIPPGDAAALAGAMTAPTDQAAAARLRERVRASFSTAAMAEGVIEAYGRALAQRRL